MPENDFSSHIDKIVKQAQGERKQEIVEEKAKKKEEKVKKTKEEKIVKPDSKSSPKEVKRERKTSYTTVIMLKVEYEGGNVPTREQLAEELGRTIINWAEQKKFYAISQKDPAPELISVDIDVQ
jgi:FtsZ-interacting cell division protein ZipA